jgi:transposase
VDPAAKAAAPSTANAAEAAPSARGHGRNGADAYGGAERIDVPHATLSAGDACPACGEGTVYDKAPGVLVRITGQPPLTARIYRLQKLRCHLCGEVFTAAVPTAAGDRKYDATAGSMIGLLKYGSGLPFNRLEGLQGYWRFLCRPRPSGTSSRQWRGRLLRPSRSWSARRPRATCCTTMTPRSRSWR